MIGPTNCASAHPVCIAVLYGSDKRPLAMPAATPKYWGAKRCTVGCYHSESSNYLVNCSSVSKNRRFVVGALTVAVHLDAGEIGVRSYTSPKLKTELYAQRPVSRSRLGLQISLKISFLDPAHYSPYHRLIHQCRPAETDPSACAKPLF